MDWRQVVRLLAVGRVFVGLALLLGTRPLGRRWLGDAVDDPATRLVVRAMGGRDLAIGIGTLRALDQNEEPRTWVLAGAVADGVDAVASLLAVGRLGKLRGFGTAALAGAAAAAGGAAADRLG